MKKFCKTSLKVMLFFIGWAVFAGIGDLPKDNPAIWRFGAELFPLLWTILFTIVFVIIDKRSVRVPIIHNWLKGSCIGLVTGALWIGTAIGIVLIFSFAEIGAKNDVAFLWLWIVSAFLNTIMQELLVRGYMYNLIKKEYSTLPAIVFTTVLFALFHGGAFEAGFVAVLNVVTMSLLASAIYEYTETLIAPILIHGIWNVIGSIVFGALSLAEDYPKLYQMNFLDNSVISGGEFGIEASVIVLVLNILLAVMFFVLCKKKKHDVIADVQF